MADLPDILQLDEIGGGRYGIHMPSTSAEGRDVVFSGQYLAQMLMAADRVHDSGKDVRSIHAVFARAATYTKPIELVVDKFLDGRSWGSDTITAIQDGKVMARSEVLLNIVEDDLLRHELTPGCRCPGRTAPRQPRACTSPTWRFDKSRTRSSRSMAPLRLRRGSGIRRSWTPKRPIRPCLRGARVER